MSTWQKLGVYTGTSHDTLARICGFQCSLVSGRRTRCGDQRQHMGSALEACSWQCTIQIRIYFTLLYF